MKHCYLPVWSVFLLCLLSGLTACRGDLDPPTPFSGDLTFSRYIAVGDEYTAGFMNGGLYPEGQEASYPNLMAKQFRLISPMAFKQPLLRNNGTGYLALDSLKAQPCDDLAPRSFLSWTEEEPLWAQDLTVTPPYHNLGLPRLKAAQVNIPFRDSQNVFGARFSTQADSSSSLISLIEARQAEFFTLWIGANDLLPYALSGGEQGPEAFTQPDTFRLSVQRLLKSLSAQNPEVPGVVANLPDFTQMPYFTSIGTSWRSSFDCQGARKPIYIQSDQTVRIIQPNEKVLLPADSLLHFQQEGLSAQFPLPDRYVLDQQELALFRQTLNTYNQILQEEVDQHNARLNQARVAFLDIHQELSSLSESGLVIDGVQVSGEYITGGMYSLDGLYPTPRGHAFITNLFLTRVNHFFNASIPPLNITDYKAVEYP